MRCLMKTINSKRLWQIYSLFLMFFTIIMGVLFIVEISNIYYSGLESNTTIYSKEIINQHLHKLIIPIILYVLSIIGGVVLSIVYKINLDKTQPSLQTTCDVLFSNLPESAKQDPQYEGVRCERKSRLIAKVLLIIACAIAATVCLVYLLQIDNFHKSGDLLEQAKNMIRYILPWFLITVLLFFFITVYFTFSYFKEKKYLKELIKAYRKKGINISQEKSEKAIRIIQYSLLIVSICFIVIGVLQGDTKEVLIKASNLCTECIGLG